jgi:4-amino-4-deoxy-L-arabinose transferase-like glycosyltransferase
MYVFQFLRFWKKNIQLICLGVILCFGLFLRIYALDSVPGGFFCDEASIGYNAFSLWQSGRDEYGKFFPLFFKSFGDYRHPLAVYSAIPFVGLFGLTEFTTRLPSVFYGVLTLCLLYLIGKEIRDGWTGLAMAFAGASMPWLIHYNRVGFEFSVYAAFFTAMVWLFVKAGKQQGYIIPAFTIAALTFYTYQPAKLLVPLWIVGMCIIYGKSFFAYWRTTALGFFVFGVLSIPVLLGLLDGTGTARFALVSVFSAHLSWQDTLLRIVNNYFFQLSPWLFFSGEDTLITRHFVEGLRPMLWSTIPFLLLGVGYVIFTFKKKSSQLLLYFLFLYPVAGALVEKSPFTSRAIIGAPLFAIFIGLGIVFLIRFGKRIIPKELFSALIIVLIVFNLLFFVRFYFTTYPMFSADFWGWQSGAKAIVSYFAAHEFHYDELLIGGADFNAPYIFYKFYDPGGCQKCKIGYPHTSYVAGKRQLFAVTPLYMQAHSEFVYNALFDIYYPTGQLAFVLAEVRK